MLSNQRFPLPAALPTRVPPAAPKIPVAQLPLGSPVLFKVQHPIDEVETTEDYNEVWPYELAQCAGMTFSMETWNVWANDYLSQAIDNNDIYAAWNAVRFALAGRIRSPEGETELFDQIRVDALLGARDGGTNYLSTDVDSAFGFIFPGGPLALTVVFTMLVVVADFKRFRSNIHLTVPVPGTNIALPPKDIPNFLFGRVGEKGTLYVFFPQLRDSLHNTIVPRKIKEEWYNHCVKPAMKAVLPEFFQYPADYHTALLHAMGLGNIVHEHSVDISTLVSESFFHLVREFATERETFGFKDVFFLVELRGLKGIGRWNVDQPGRHAALDYALFRFADRTITSPLNQWIADLAVEISSDNGSVRLRRDSIADVLRYIIPTLTEEGARRAVSSVRTTIDTYAHLGQIAGFRSEFSPENPETLDVFFVQAYFTEKHQTTALGHSTIFSLIETEEASPTRIDRLAETLKKRSDTIYDWLSPPDNSAPHVDGALRLEIRTRMSSAGRYLITPPTRAQMSAWCPVIPGGRLLTHIYNKTLALRLVVDVARQMINVADAWQSETFLLLLAWIIDYANGLHQREHPHSWKIKLRSALGRRDCEYDAYDDEFNVEDLEHITTDVGLDHGMRFLSDIYLDVMYPAFVVPNVSEDFFVDDPTQIYKYFGGESMLEILERFKIKAKKTHVLKQTSHSSRCRVITQPGPDVIQAQRSYHLPSGPPVIVEGSDRMKPNLKPVAYHDQPGAAGKDRARQRTRDPVRLLGPPQDLGKFLRELIRQICVDVLVHGPNRQGKENPAYVLLDPRLRHRVTSATYMSLDLRGIFEAVHVRTASRVWREALGHCVPPKGKDLPKKLQGFGKARFFSMWKERILRYYSIGQVDRIRQAVIQELDKFAWFPAVQSGKLWKSTKATSKDTVTLGVGAGSLTSLPWIVLNPARNCLDLRLGARRAIFDEMVEKLDEEAEAAKANQAAEEEEYAYRRRNRHRHDNGQSDEEEPTGDEDAQSDDMDDSPEDEDEDYE